MNLEYVKLRKADLDKGDAMGMKGKTWLAFCVLFLVFFMSMSSIVWAQENMCVAPTGTGVVNELASSLKVYAGNNLIDPDNPVYLRAAWGCYPYQYSWQIAGRGYSLSKATTNGDLDYTILSVVDGACDSDYDPYVTLTVTDTCNNTGTIKVRNEGGTWGQPLYEWYVRCQCGGGECQSCWSWSYCQTVIPGGGCDSHRYDEIEDEVGNQRYITTGWHCNCAAGCGASSTTMNWCGAPDGSIYEVPGTSGLVKDEYCPPGCPNPFGCNIGTQDCYQPWYPPELRTWCIPDKVKYYEWRCQ